jgi:hypothetical protein
MIFKRMTKAKIYCWSHLVAFQRNLNTGPDQDIAEIATGMLDFLMLSISFDVLRVISSLFFFTITQCTVPGHDQIRNQNETKLLLLSINDCTSLEDCLRPDLVHWTKAKEDGNHSLVSFF